jgi:hypothetical protein
MVFSTGSPTTQITVSTYEIEPYMVTNGIPVPVTDYFITNSVSSITTAGAPIELVQDPVDVEVPFTYRWQGFDLRPFGDHAGLTGYGSAPINVTIPWGSDTLVRSGVTLTAGWMESDDLGIGPPCTVVVVAILNSVYAPLALSSSTTTRSGLTVISDTLVCTARRDNDQADSPLVPALRSKIPVLLGGLVNPDNSRSFCVDGRGFHYGGPDLMVPTYPHVASLGTWLFGKDPDNAALIAPAYLLDVIILDRLPTSQEMTKFYSLAASYGVQ